MTEDDYTVEAEVAAIKTHVAKDKRLRLWLARGIAETYSKGDKDKPAGTVHMDEIVQLSVGNSGDVAHGMLLLALHKKRPAEGQWQISFHGALDITDMVREMVELHPDLLKPEAAAEPAKPGTQEAEHITEECYSCGEEMPEKECPSSHRPCGHHCNHSWSHDACCWCKKEFGEEASVAEEAAALKAGEVIK